MGNVTECTKDAKMMQKNLLKTKDAKLLVKMQERFFKLFKNQKSVKFELKMLLKF